MTRIIVLHASDNVGTAVADLEPGEVLELGGRRVAVAEPVPFGHKVALAAIAQGQPILKYGEQIGLARIAIAEGGCVHVHNVESQRGRGDLETAAAPAGTSGGAA